ncbi:MAG: MFS transporter [Actinomycetota bacterium]|nr:MFS transporter [Actinomycetota bacterium]MEC9395574.1 MFS transporter [Actinomycetota bacterium]MEE2957591.1 MFS transporter [Actinomycetota bacterium]
MVDPRARPQWQVILFMAFVGMSTAYGIDASLPAFDEMRPDVGLPPGSNRITLSITVYFLGMAIGQPIYGPVADRFGRYPTLQAAMAIYAVGATGSMLATDFGFLLASRTVWGIGASGASLMHLTMVRDLFSGDRMARVMSLISAVFLVGPVIGPLVAEGILQVASWRWVYAVALLFAGAISMAGWRFGETLDPAHRRPLRIGPTLEAARRVVGCRRAVLYIAAVTVGDGTFLIFLGSSQQVFDVVYDRADQFAVLFAATAVVFAIGFLLLNPAIARWGAHPVGLTVVAAALAVHTLLLVLTVAADGTPGFWTWLALVTVGSALLALLLPIAISRALEPLGDVAGTASGILGFGHITCGAMLAALIGIQLGETTMPWAVGAAAYNALALVILIAAGRTPDPLDEDPAVEDVEARL